MQGQGLGCSLNGGRGRAQAIDGLDADVLTIENSRSGDEMLRALAKYGYARDIGAGVYDVHSPVVPTCAPRPACAGTPAAAASVVGCSPVAPRRGPSLRALQRSCLL